MNAAHQHLLINHFPVICLIIGILVMLIGVVSKSSVTRRVALLVFFIGGVMAIPSFSTGEGAEEILEHIPGVEHARIHEHEEHAEKLMPFMWGLIILSLLALFLEWKQKSMAMIASITVLLVGMIATYFARETARTGGEISHSEIRKGFVLPTGEEHEH